MVHPLVISAGSKAIRAGYKALTVDQKVLVKVGWKPTAAKAISHGIAISNIANNLGNDSGIEPDGSQIFNGNSASTPNKARGGFKRGTSRKYNKFFHNGAKCRCTRPRKFRRRRNRR